MEYWQRNKDGVRFDTEEDAWLDSIENEDQEDLFNTLLGHNLIPQEKMLEWIMGQDGFWEAFQDEITEARTIIFNYDYSCWDDEPNAFDSFAEWLNHNKVDEDGFICSTDPDGNDNPFGSCFWRG